MIKEKDFIGKMYGDLEIISFDGIKKRNRIVTCLCNCGIKKQMIFNNVKKGKSCGCKKGYIKKGYWDKKHIYYNINKIYSGIKYRCYNKKHIRADHYSNKGIKMSQERFEDVDIFIDDMYKSYKKHCLLYGKENTTIDRIDNNGNYCKTNCRRVTRAEQNNNTSRNIFFKYKGESVTQKQLAQRIGISEYHIRCKLRMGFSKEEVISHFLKEHNLLDEEPQGETCEHESDGGVYLTLRKEGEEVKPPKSKCKKCGVFYRN